MSKHLLLILFLCVSVKSFSQIDSLIDSFINKKIPSSNAVTKSSIIKRDSVKNNSINFDKKVSTVAATDSAQHRVSFGHTSVSDSLKKDSSQNDSAFLQLRNNSVSGTDIKSLSWQEDKAFRDLFLLSFSSSKLKPVFRPEEKRNIKSKDELFYTLLGLIYFLAFIKVAFPKEFKTYFKAFFQASFREKQARESLIQNSIPSLLLNLFFVLSAGLLITIIALQQQFAQADFLKLFLYCIVIIAIFYLFKFLIIRLSGLLFRVKNAARNYIFVSSLTNKIFSVLVMPFLLLLAFAPIVTAEVLSTLITSLFILIQLYSYALLFSFVQRNLKVNLLSFFIYLCIVEVLPMIILYKYFFNPIGNFIQIIHFSIF